MRIILTKGTVINGKKQPIGSRMEVTPEFFKNLGDSATEYGGPMITDKRVRTNLFKPNKQQPKTEEQ
jgi:hypothetical protein